MADDREIWVFTFRTGAIGVCLVALFLLLPVQTTAFYSQETRAWSNGMQVQVVMQNTDMWTTGVTNSIYVTLTLKEVGFVTDFVNLTFVVFLVTEVNQTSVTIIDEPWDSAGDKIDLEATFMVTPQSVNYAEWSLYEADFYYQLNQSVVVNGTWNQECYTSTSSHHVLSISTLSFVAIWPFPPIFAMMAIFWALFIVIRRFNKRYAPLIEAEKEAKKKAMEKPKVEEQKPAGSDWNQSVN